MNFYSPEILKDAKNWVSSCIENKQAFGICGKGTRLLSTGYSGESYKSIDILSMKKMESILFFDPDDMVVGIESGVSVKLLKKILAEKNMILPVNSWYPESCIGSVIACNDFGPNRMNMGGIRDFIIGIEYISGNGEIVKAGGKVVKNVSGYDLTRLMLGSQGGLGVITSVNFKVLPKPKDPFGMFGIFRDESWLSKVKEIHKNRIPIDWIEAASLVDTGWILGLGYSGNAACRNRIENEINNVFGKKMSILPDGELFNGQNFTPGSSRFDGFLKVFRDSWGMNESNFHIFLTSNTEKILNFPIDYFRNEDFKILIHPIGGDIHLMHKSSHKIEQYKLLEKIKSTLVHPYSKLRWVSGASNCDLKDLDKFGVANGYSLTRRLKNHLDPSGVFLAPYYDLELDL